VVLLPEQIVDGFETVTLGNELTVAITAVLAADEHPEVVFLAAA
jgi:hypothetical protein